MRHSATRSTFSGAPSRTMNGAVGRLTASKSARTSATLFAGTPAAGRFVPVSQSKSFMGKTPCRGPDPRHSYTISLSQYLLEFDARRRDDRAPFRGIGPDQLRIRLRPDIARACALLGELLLIVGVLLRR